MKSKLGVVAVCCAAFIVASGNLEARSAIGLPAAVQPIPRHAPTVPSSVGMSEGVPFIVTAVAPWVVAAVAPLPHAMARASNAEVATLDQ